MDEEQGPFSKDTVWVREELPVLKEMFLHGRKEKAYALMNRMVATAESPEAVLREFEEEFGPWARGL